MNVEIDGEVGKLVATCKSCGIKLVIPNGFDLGEALIVLTDFAADH